MDDTSEDGALTLFRSRTTGVVGDDAGNYVRGSRVLSGVMMVTPNGVKGEVSMPHELCQGRWKAMRFVKMHIIYVTDQCKNCRFVREQECVPGENQSSWVMDLSPFTPFGFTS